MCSHERWTHLQLRSYVFVFRFFKIKYAKCYVLILRKIPAVCQRDRWRRDVTMWEIFGLFGRDLLGWCDTDLRLCLFFLLK